MTDEYQAVQNLAAAARALAALCEEHEEGISEGIAYVAFAASGFTFDAYQAAVEVLVEYKLIRRERHHLFAYKETDNAIQ